MTSDSTHIMLAVFIGLLGFWAALGTGLAGLLRQENPGDVLNHYLLSAVFAALAVYGTLSVLHWH